MCCVPCGPRRRSSSRESIIPVERIKKADVEYIICAYDYECLFKRTVDAEYRQYEGCSANLIAILHQGNTKVKVAGSRTPGYKAGYRTIVMTAPCVNATILLRVPL